MSHQTISFIKSAIRIIGYSSLICAGELFYIMPLFWGGIVLVLSEIIGILEEVGER